MISQKLLESVTDTERYHIIHKNTIEKQRLHEYSNISVIITDMFFESLYENCKGGYYEALDVVFEATDSFYMKFKNELENPKTYWDDIFDLYKEQDITGYADLVTYETYEYFTKVKKFIIRPEKIWEKDKEPNLHININILNQTFNYF
jgi:hypothetical protein